MKDGWTRKKLSELFTIRPQKKQAKEKLNDNDEISFVPMKCLNVDDRNLTLIPTRTLKAVYGGYTYFVDNDVLLAKITPCFENGKVGIARNLKNGIGFGSSEFIVFRSEGKVIPEYLYYYLSQESFRQEGKAMMAGAVGHKRVSKEFINDYQLPFPESIQEQKRIVAILDEVCAAVDKAKANAERNLNNARELFESYLNGIFANPREDWERKKLIDCCDQKDQIVSGPFGSNLKVSDYKKTGVPIIRLQNIGNGYFIKKDIKHVSNEKAEELKYHSYKPGDLVLAKLGIPIGKTCFIPEDFPFGIIVADVVRIRPNKTVIDYSFLKYYLNSELSVSQLKDNITGSTRPRVNLNHVRGVQIPLPPLSEQKRIVVALDRLSAKSKQLESIYQQKLTALDELKKSILKKAFEGEL